MRALTLFTTTLAIVLGMSLTAQAGTISTTADASSYAVSDVITITVIGDSQGDLSPSIFGRILYDPSVVAPLGGQTQTKLKTSDGTKWTTGGLNVDPIPNTQDSFNAIGPLGTVAPDTTKKLTAVMTFHALGSGTAVFSWQTAGGMFSFFGVQDGVGPTGETVTIVPEPTTAGLMGLGLLGLVVAGRRRRKS
jgi:hypothetical protein